STAKMRARARAPARRSPATSLLSPPRSRRRSRVHRPMPVIAAGRDSGALPRGAVATIGNYDGIHRGQRAILDRVVARARELQAPSAVITFDPHPLAFLRPREAPPRLASRQQKEKLVEAAGIDFMLEL